MSVIRWDPFRELMTLQDRMNRLFEEANRGWRTSESPTAAWSPAVDIYETEAEIIVQAELPGVERKDIELHLENNVLTIKGDRPFQKESKDENYHRIERSYGRFTRSFSIPAAVDEAQIRAEYKEGVLTVTMPKSAKARPRQIPIGG